MSDQTQVIDTIPDGLAQSQTTTYLMPDGALGGPPVSVASSVAPVGPGTPQGFQEWAEKWVTSISPGVERKAAEYGSGSLARKGWRYAQAQGRAVGNADALELGAAQYLLEKLDRVEDSMLRQQRPSDDTWLDIAVYALMAMYVREHGHWL